MSTNGHTKPPEATYTFHVRATLDGVGGTLDIHTPSVNELKRAIRLLIANAIIPQPAEQEQR